MKLRAYTSRRRLLLSLFIVLLTVLATLVAVRVLHKPSAEMQTLRSIAKTTQLPAAPSVTEEDSGCYFDEKKSYHCNRYIFYVYESLSTVQKYRERITASKDWQRFVPPLGMNPDTYLFTNASKGACLVIVEAPHNGYRVKGKELLYQIQLYSKTSDACSSLFKLKAS